MKMPAAFLLGASVMLMGVGCGADNSTEQDKDIATQEQSAVAGCVTTVTEPYVAYSSNGTPYAAAKAAVTCALVQPYINVAADITLPGVRGSRRGHGCANAVYCEVEAIEGYVPGVWQAQGLSPVGGDTAIVAKPL
ncbi:hypothetical protein HPC49_33755 [Pyxidicoccus fallax]|uniref:Lipoprotein n=1 Tax=Pyxidicoccus fallax TaxID=394095 RepID=A0A848LGY1_9BACT|nr:hypothetical protein [Pyxidicoccus fallax]NMO15438.1 hypothetical protein [Pyxidicoccus fallax]NPC83174.1 hypothetical protein [Pyxidicoccus fallax]